MLNLVKQDGLTANIAPLSRIDIGSSIVLNLLLSVPSGVVILVTGAPYVEVLKFVAS
jgi:hypothetical protein